MYLKLYMYRREGKGRRCCLGTELLKFLAALSILPVKIILFFNLSWRNSSYSWIRPLANRPILQLVLVYSKIASAARNGSNSVPQKTFASSSVSFFYGMSFLSSTHLPKWFNSPGKLKRDLNRNTSGTEGTPCDTQIQIIIYEKNIKHKEFFKNVGEN